MREIKGVVQSEKRRVNNVIILNRPGLLHDFRSILKGSCPLNCFSVSGEKRKLKF
jgi:hypothetical protein